MARNIEIKARADDLARLASRVAPLADHGPERIDQDDTFFKCGQSRLKLRAFPDGRGELIAYERPDVVGPKTSTYQITPVADPDALRTTLLFALGDAGRVLKRRTLYRVGRTRLHLDRVDGLGDFLELEVVLRDGEPEAMGLAEAHALLDRLEVTPDQLVAGAYVDLLNARTRHAPRAAD